MRLVMLLMVMGWSVCYLSSVDAQPKGKGDTESAIDKLAEDLRNPNPNVRLKAVQKLGQLEGADKDRVSMLLCDAILDPVPTISKTALQLLENVYPELYKYIVVIVLDKSSSNKIRAIRGLSKMGTKARPATRLLHKVISSSILEHDLPLDASLNALRQMEAYDLETLNLMKNIIFTVQIPYRGEKKYIRDEDKILALEYLVEWAGTDQLKRKELIPLLKVGLGRSGGELLMKSIEISGSYGELAADLLPLLKGHKLSSDARIREAASKAVEKIEKR
jgi:HEAT repeat protein